MKKVIVVLALLLALPIFGQAVELTVTKSGSDAVLTWTGGIGPYAVIRSSSPTLTARTVTISADATSPTSDVDGLTRGVRIEYYVVSRTDVDPDIAISTPSPDFTSPKPCICATGTASADATAVYVNGEEATGITSWASCADTTGVPISVPYDPKQGNKVIITASARSAEEDWNYVMVSGTYTGTITANVACKERKFGE